METRFIIEKLRQILDLWGSKGFTEPGSSSWWSLHQDMFTSNNNLYFPGPGSSTSGTQRQKAEWCRPLWVKHKRTAANWAVAEFYIPTPPTSALPPPPAGMSWAAGRCDTDRKRERERGRVMYVSASQRHLSCLLWVWRRRPLMGLQASPVFHMFTQYPQTHTTSGFLLRAEDYTSD